jgi:nucleoid DNA-binding protein
MSNSVSKRNLWQYVNLKINRLIHHYHVFSIITILFEEMLQDLKQNKPIKIMNFGTLSLKKMRPRKYHDVVYREVKESRGSKIMRFTLAPSLRKKLCESLNLDKDERNEYK